MFSYTPGSHLKRQLMDTLKEPKRVSVFKLEVVAYGFYPVYTAAGASKLTRDKLHDRKQAKHRLARFLSPTVLFAFFFFFKKMVVCFIVFRDTVHGQKIPEQYPL